MPRPPKPFTVLKTENKSHKTKAELKQRQQGEEALASGTALKERPEVKNNPVAHKEFIRLNKLLKNIEKNDAVYESVINRYCLLQAECKEFEEKRERFFQDAEELEDVRAEMEPVEYFKLKVTLDKQALAIDKQVQTKRKMLLDIEKENIMTIAAALRCIPKTQEKTGSKLLEALNG